MTSANCLYICLPGLPQRCFLSHELDRRHSPVTRTGAPKLLCMSYTVPTPPSRISFCLFAFLSTPPHGQGNFTADGHTGHPFFQGNGIHIPPGIPEICPKSVLLIIRV